MSSFRLPRRRFLALGAASLAATALGGCDPSDSPEIVSVLDSAEGLTYRHSGCLAGAILWAREFSAADISPCSRSTAPIRRRATNYGRHGRE